MDALSRLLSGIYEQHKALPKHLIVVLDNTARDNKNNFIIRYFIKCRLLRIFESIYIAFPEKGHTHGPLDAVGGQAVTKCSNAEFHTAHELCEVYQEFLDKAAFEPGTFRKAVWKQDQAADWRQWVEEVPLKFGCLTGPAAPHGFRILHRQQLDVYEDVERTSWPGAPRPHPGDLVMAIHRQMSDERPYQVCLLVPAQEIDGLRKSLSLQPSGSHARKHIAFTDREEICRKAKTCFNKGGINQAALDYLTGWAQGTLRREPRPVEYSFLRHRFDSEPDSFSRAKNPHQCEKPRQVVVLQRGGVTPTAAAPKLVQKALCLRGLAAACVSGGLPLIS